MCMMFTPLSSQKTKSQTSVSQRSSLLIYWRKAQEGVSCSYAGVGIAVKEQSDRGFSLASPIWA